MITELHLRGRQFDRLSRDLQQDLTDLPHTLSQGPDGTYRSLSWRIRDQDLSWLMLKYPQHHALWLPQGEVQ